MLEHGLCNDFASHSIYVSLTQRASPPFPSFLIDYKYRPFFIETASWYPATLDAIEICDAYGEFDVLHIYRHLVT